MSKPREFWILFRQYDTVVMESKKAILKAYPNPTNPEVNLLHVIEYAAYQRVVKRLKQAMHSEHVVLQQECYHFNLSEEGYIEQELAKLEAEGE